MAKFYQIQEFAELAGVTVKALHHYERRGLLKPRRSRAGYRIYTERELERLQQIVALKFLGFSLSEIKAVLDRSVLELPDALRLQRQALEQKQRRLDRAIMAIRVAERAIVRGKPADPAILQTLIKAVIGVQDDIEAMKQYYSEEAWAKRKDSYKNGPSQEWKDLFRDVQAALGEDPEGDNAQALATRWLELVEREPGDGPEVRLGAIKAWADRGNWAPTMRQRIADYNLEAVVPFIQQAMVAYRRKYYSDDAWAKLSDRTPEQKDQLSAAWHALFAEVRAFGGDPTTERGQALAVRWMELAEQWAASQPEIKAGAVEAWKDRANWPEMMRRHSAMIGAEQVADFIGKASAHNRKQRSKK